MDKFDVFEMFATDPKLEVDGTWLPQTGGASLKVARAGNKAYGKLIKQEFDQNQVLLEAGGDAAEELDDKIVIDVMAKTILLDWKDLYYKGALLPYSYANACELLKHRDFRLHVGRLAQDRANYKASLEAKQGEI